MSLILYLIYSNPFSASTIVSLHRQSVLNGTAAQREKITPLHITIDGTIYVLKVNIYNNPGSSFTRQLFSRKCNSELVAGWRCWF